MKEFLKQWKEKRIKGMNKDSRDYLLNDYLPVVVSDYMSKAHKMPEQVTELFDRMEDVRFVNTLNRVIKNDEDYAPVDTGMATIIADFLENRHEKLSDDMIAVYGKAVDRILKDRIKEVSKKTGIRNKELLKELLVVMPDPSYTNAKFISIYVQCLSNKLYALSKNNELGLTNVKTVKSLYKEIFGKKLLNAVAASILLERKEHIANFNENQLAIWNLLTNFALQTIEKNDKAEVREVLEFFASTRIKDATKERDAARRIQFASISEEDYPKIHKAFGKLSRKEKYSKYL